MNSRYVPVAADRPVFVLGERPAAMELVRALGDTPTLCAMPPIRLLADLVTAVDRCLPDLQRPAGLASDGLRPGRWYGDVQLAQLRATGRMRTVEFSALSILRLCVLFPGAQFLVVRQLSRALPRARRLPSLAQGRILQIDSNEVTGVETLERVLAFLGEPAEPVEPVVVDLSDAIVAPEPLRGA